MSGTRLAGVDLEGETLYRIGRRPSVWAWPDWAYAGDDGTFGNRWDDPDRHYRVLYGALQRRGAFLETLARFRPDPELLAAYDEIEAEEGEEPEPPLGELPRSWLSARMMGVAQVTGRFALPGHSDSLAFLRRRMASSLVRYGLGDLDAATIRLSTPRAFTQEVSRLVFEATGPGERRQFDGIRYASRLGDELENLALFEAVDSAGVLSVTRAGEELSPEDPDLCGVLEVFGLRFAPGAG